MILCSGRILKLILFLSSAFLGVGFKHFLFSPRFGKDSLILTNIFQMGWFNHQPDFKIDVLSRGQPKSYSEK